MKEKGRKNADAPVAALAVVVVLVCHWRPFASLVSSRHCPNDFIIASNARQKRKRKIVKRNVASSTQRKKSANASMRERRTSRSCCRCCCWWWCCLRLPLTRLCYSFFSRARSFDSDTKKKKIAPASFLRAFFFLSPRRPFRKQIKNSRFFPI